jgi:TnpA family transposase
MESFNGANSVIAYGNEGRSPRTGVTSRRRSRCVCRSCSLPRVNTLMLQDVLDESESADLLTPADRRGLTRLF